jgi:hypothetical protein
MKRGSITAPLPWEEQIPEKFLLPTAAGHHTSAAASLAADAADNVLLYYTLYETGASAARGCNFGVAVHRELMLKAARTRSHSRAVILQEDIRHRR